MSYSAILSFAEWTNFGNIVKCAFFLYVKIFEAPFGLTDYPSSYIKLERNIDQVKSISADDQKTLHSAIAMVSELATRSINDADAVKNGMQPESPVTPVSPNKRKFSFRFPTPVTAHSSRSEGRTFSDEAASIPDLQVRVAISIFSPVFFFCLSFLYECTTRKFYVESNVS